MKIVTKSAIALSLMLITTPASATVLINPVGEAAAGTIFVESANEPSAAVRVGPGNTGIVRDAPLFLPMSMLPAPSDWVLLLAGFGVIGYAMRSRKYGRVSFN